MAGHATAAKFVANVPFSVMNNTHSILVAFPLITSLFFLRGFAHHLDPILIPHLKKAFTDGAAQATLEDALLTATAIS